MQDRLEELKKQLDDDFREPRHRTRNEIEREIESFYLRSERVARKTRSRLHRHIDYELNGKTGQRRRQALADFLLDRQGRPRVDGVAAFSFKFKAGLSPALQKALADLDMPVINALTLYRQTTEQWQASPQGMNNFAVAFP